MNLYTNTNKKFTIDYNFDFMFELSFDFSIDKSFIIDLSFLNLLTFKIHYIPKNYFDKVYFRYGFSILGIEIVYSNLKLIIRNAKGI